VVGSFFVAAFATADLSERRHARTEVPRAEHGDDRREGPPVGSLLAGVGAMIDA
jgi:hypothetical protein